MTSSFLFLAIAFVIPTVVTAIVNYFADDDTRIAIRKAFIVLLYLNPWNWGASFDWNCKPTLRETRFIVWFTVFVLTLAVNLMLS